MSVLISAFEANATSEGMAWCISDDCATIRELGVSFSVGRRIIASMCCDS